VTILLAIAEEPPPGGVRTRCAPPYTSGEAASFTGVSGVGAWCAVRDMGRVPAEGSAVPGVREGARL